MHPILFTFHWRGVPHEIHAYGVILLIGFLLALWRAVVVVRQNGEKPISGQDVQDVATWMLLLGIVGARLTFVLLDPDRSHYSPLDVIAIWKGGMSFDGALLGGMIGLLAFARVRHIPALALFDLFAPPAALGYAVGRVGCFFNGCCYGAPTSLPWGVRFHDGGILTVPSQPTQLYATAMGLLLFVALSWLQSKHSTQRGTVFMWYLIGSGIERFIMEIWRAGYTSDLVRSTPFTTAQFFCFFLVAVGGAGLLMLRRVRQYTPSTTKAPST